MEQIREQLAQIITKLFDISDVEVEISPVPEGQKGDYASNIALRLAGVLKSQPDAPHSPRDLAEAIKTEFEAQNPEISVKIAGPGFLNFILSDGYFVQKTAEISRNFEKNISRNEYLGQKVICEFSDPNPFKVLHVGHLYTSMVGDSIARMIECAGGSVIRANFGGDVGLHVAKTLYALLSDNSASETIAITPENLARYYVEGTRAYEDDEKAHQKITELNSLIYQIADKGPDFDWTSPSGTAESPTPNTSRNADPEFTTDKVASVYWQGREVSYQYFEDFYGKIGVKFDKYYPESTVAKRGLAEVKNGLEKGIYEKSAGAIVFSGEKYGLHTRVFVNRAGLPTYEAKDVGLLFTKWDDYHFDKSIVITGNDIIEYMKVVLKSIELMQPELAKRTIHLTHGNVRLPGNEKMSSRKGNFIKAIDVLNEVETLISNAKKDPESSKTLSPDEESIALGAIRYAFLKYRIGGNIEFDAKESVSTTGNSGVYLQYSAVRAKKMLTKCKTIPSDSQSNTQTEPTTTLHDLAPEERELMKKLSEYHDILTVAIHELAPHKIATYLYESAQVFSRFYENVKVAGNPREAELAKLVTVYLKTMEHGLSLLGITIPDEM